ncbi:MAG: hypothetical protein JSR82_00305 [Verrucomicrobia bacterium]|nr:hypothetical protein [Verrucomicrobiota bacterium]
MPLTAPWSELNLPVQDGAAVWASSPAQFKAQHKGDRRAVLAAYVEAFKRQGWSLLKLDQSRSNWYVDLAKGAAKIQIELYDFKKTGVIIQKL